MKRYIKSSTQDNYLDLDSISYDEMDNFPITLKISRLDASDETLQKMYRNYPNFLYWLKKHTTQQVFRSTKARLGDLIDSYDDQIHRSKLDSFTVNKTSVYESISKGISDFPSLNLSVKEKPQSVYLYWSISKSQLLETDNQTIIDNIDLILNWLCSIPDAGKISAAWGHIQIDLPDIDDRNYRVIDKILDQDREAGRRVVVPFGVIPVVNNIRV